MAAIITTPSDTDDKNEELNKNIANNADEEPTSENITSQINLETTLKDEQDKIINLKFGNKGTYGIEDEYNIRYYIPSGNYRVIDNSGSSFGFFVVENEKVKNSEGKLEDVIVEDVRFKSGDKEKNVTIPKDTHIILFLNSDFNFIKTQD